MTIRHFVIAILVIPYLLVLVPMFSSRREPLP